MFKNGGCDSAMEQTTGVDTENLQGFGQVHLGL